MTPVLVRQHLPHAGPVPRADQGARARDWSEIQERMLVPLYEAVHQRLDVGPDTRLLALGCGSGLALVMAASRGAALTGVEPSSPARLALARERLQPDRPDGPHHGGAHPRTGIRLTDRLPADRPGPRTPAHTLVTAFEPIGRVAGDAEALTTLLTAAVPLARRGAPVVLTGWGPPERCATTAVLRVAARLAEQDRGTVRLRPALRDDLEEVAQRAGLRPDGSGRVACPFGYADLDSALKGLLSTGLFDAAVTATDQAQVEKELTEALHPYRRPDGTVWMPNVFRYLIARTP
ncbi:SAM-dependent methyltransferase [Streptomyces antibioticus]|uniref:class I SAM-dependent methyltransferase n=1 Tax=Streptomyces TaxID=1883 RepID=UPI0015876387|nr:SAM-dependent methyltransferase [Streptomyces sp. CAI-85]MBO7939426.1 SAM-dependent methyltransferase [Streptomyces sp. S9]NUV63364.1 SAM-dependent methyltransferase [Streptomyces sp. CAI-85]